MPLVPAYEAIAGRLIDLAEDLTIDDAATIVPASPAWTVKDVYAHLAGAAADVVAGVAAGDDLDGWTARQVANRADQTIEQNCVEWAGHIPEFLGIVERTGNQLLGVVAGNWVHEQDIRGAVGLQGLTTGRGLDVVLLRVDEVAGRIESAGAPALRIITPDRQWVLGTGTVAATLTVPSFELARVISSRRTAQQIASLDWDGDPSPYTEIIGVFGPASAPLDV
jgi:uncharacterized protein (TIGR03083 family)